MSHANIFDYECKLCKKKGNKYEVHSKANMWKHIKLDHDTDVMTKKEHFRLGV